MATRRALLIGNDSYDDKALGDLYTCVQDVQKLAPLLAQHEDGTPNFSVETIDSNSQEVTEALLNRALTSLFESTEEEQAEVLCFYFAGHGRYVAQRSSGYIAGKDSQEGDWGIPMEQLIGQANRAKADQVIVILDCCHAGSIDKSFATGSLASPREGVCILAGARDREPAKGSFDGGLFTELIVGALSGGGANPVTGVVTVAGLHSYVASALTPAVQSPLFKANVAKWCEIRHVHPLVTKEAVVLVMQEFSDPEQHIKLDKTFEPTAPPKGHANEALFARLQQLRGAGLVEPVGEDHLYFAAMNKRSCRLTPLGRYYWMLVRRGLFP